MRVRYNSLDVQDYIARFNLAYVCCTNVTKTLAKPLFEEDLLINVSVQVLNAEPSFLKES